MDLKSDKMPPLVDEPCDKIRWTRWVSGIQAIAQTGLTFAHCDFDKERYHALLEIAAQMASASQPEVMPDVFTTFMKESGYATPKIDVRGAIIQDNQILLVKEKSDQKWTLPGGWADVNESPAECMRKEILEEAGVVAKVTKLIALYDKLKHDHPPQWPHAYKCFFLCEIESGKLQPGLETAEVAFFERDDLPVLSEHRVTAAQILRCFEHAQHLDWPTDFD